MRACHSSARIRANVVLPTPIGPSTTMYRALLTAPSALDSRASTTRRRGCLGHFGPWCAAASLASVRAVKTDKSNDRDIAVNRRARFEFHIEETFEAGIVLLGSEVKALRNGKANLKDSFGRIEGDEVFL